MATELELQKANEDLKSALKTLSEEKAKLEASIKEMGTQNVQAKLDVAANEIKAKDSTIKDLTESLAKANTELNSVKTQTDEYKTKNDALVSELDEIKAKQLKANRFNKLTKDLELAKEDAESLVVTLAKLNDEEFNAYITSAKKYLVKSKKTEEKKTGIRAAEEVISNAVAGENTDLAVGNESSDNDFQLTVAEVSEYFASKKGYNKTNKSGKSGDEE